MSGETHTSVEVSHQPEPAVQAAPAPALPDPTYAGGASARRSDVANVLALQRTAGNAAVAGWLAGRSSPRSVSRYEAGEHAQFGGDEKVMVNGVPISQGNLIAMGDFFRTPEEMYAADPEVLRQLDAAITQDRRARLGEKGPDGKPLKTPTNDDIQKITKPLGAGNTYMDLNKQNEAHFAPPKGGPTDGKDHKSTFEKFHRQALDEAHEVSQQSRAPAPEGASTSPPAPAPVTEPPLPGPVRAPTTPSPDGKPATASVVPPKAIASNMFAAHYLTDAFAAGHLINKQEVMDQAKESWKKLPNTGGMVLQKNSFTDQVSERVLADPEVQRKMSGMQIINLNAILIGGAIGGGVGAVLGGIAGAFGGGPVGAGAGVVLGGLGGAALGGAIAHTFAGYTDVTKDKLSEVLHVTSRVKPEVFFNIFARMVHDKLNRDGVMVTNGNGASWKLSGDESLNKESLEYGRKAVAESEKNLEEAATNPAPVAHDAMFARVWKHVPHPTEEGQKFIDKVRDELTNAGNAEAVDEAVKLSVKEIATAIDEMLEMGILRPKPGATAPPAVGAPGPPGAGGAPPAPAPAPPDSGAGSQAPVPAGVP